MSAAAYPQPREDTDNAPMLAAWKRGRLGLQHCGDCESAIFYPRPICPNCWSDNLIWRDASGRDTIVSYTLVYRPNHESFNTEVPIVLAEITLAEGASMIARILCDASAVRSGLAVALTQDQATIARYPLPVFELLESSS